MAQTIVDYKKIHQKKAPFQENKRPNYWARPMQISKIKRKKLNGLNYWAWPIKTAEMDRADSILRPFHLVVSLPRQLATVDPTWYGRIASDQNSWSLNLRPFFCHKRLRPFQKKGRYSQFTTPSF